MKIFKLVSIVFIFFYSFTYSQWTQIPLGTSVELFDVHFISVDTGWVVGRNSTILKTTNGGIYWTPQQINVNTEITSVNFSNANIGWGAGSNGVIIKTTNGGESWVQKPSGINETIYGIYFATDMEGVAVSASWYNGYPHLGHILKTTDGGETWSIKITDYYDGLIDVFFIDKNQGWACGSRGTLYNTTDGGNTWNLINQFTGYWLNAVYFYNKNEGIVVGGNESSDIIYKSTDSGNTWTKMRESYQTTSLFGLWFIDEQIGWTCGYNGVILRTTNAGISWHTEETGVNNLLNKIIMIDSVGYCVGVNGTFLKYQYSQPTINIKVLSPNGGEAWGIGSTEQILWNSIDIVNVKIEYSYNNGASWNTVVASYPSTGVYNWTVPNIISNQALVKISDIVTSDFDKSDSTFRIIEPTEVSEIFNSQIPDYYYLYQNYPNPFNPTTNIRFDLVKESYIVLKVYDLNGREIENLIEDYKPAGSYNISYEPKELTSGIYFYRIITKDFTDVKKMIFLK